MQWLWLVLMLSMPSWSAASSTSEASRLAIGANYLGGQIDYRTENDYGYALRYIRSTAQSDAGPFTASVYGIRAYKSFRLYDTYRPVYDYRDHEAARPYRERSYRPYAGLELAVVQARSSAYQSAGGTVGAFLGVERKIVSRVWVAADLGTYLFSLREKSTGVSETSVEVVGNFHVMLYLF